jgi:hypothetical protein
MEQKGENLVVRIPQFEEYVKLSDKRRAKYKEGPNGEFLLDKDGNKILANSRTAGTPRYKKISGQDMYSGMNKHTRAKMIGFIKEYLYSHIRGANRINTYPIQIELIVKHTKTVHKLNRIKNTWDDTGMDWDLDNFTLIWRKAIGDVLCGNVQYTKQSDGKGNKKYKPNYEKYPPIIDDDNINFVQRWIETFKPVDTPEERELIIIISKFDDDLYYYGKI